MNVNIYLEDKLAHQLNEFTHRTGKSRNLIIREAVKEWLEHHGTKNQWPKSILNFKGCPDLPAFESARDELHSAKEDPLA